MKINIDSCVIEGGRMCNHLNPITKEPCKHCLRGYPQNKVISDEVIDKFFSQVNYISEITFGGGEPSLYLKQIRKIIAAILKYDVDVGNFYIVTNGREFSEELIEICELLYHNICTENEISGLAVSDDKFHKENHEDIKKFEYNKFLYYYENEFDDEMRLYARKDKETDFSKVSIINMGMAKINGIGNRELDIYLPYKEIWDDEIVVRDTELYLTYDGRLLPCCDLSYDVIDSNKYTIGNIMIENLLEIVQRLPEEDDEHKFEIWKGGKK